MAKSIPQVKIGNEIYDIKDKTAREHLIEVKEGNVPPTSPDNKLWIKGQDAEYLVPTYDEHNELKSAVNVDGIAINSVSNEFDNYFDRANIINFLSPDSRSAISNCDISNISRNAVSLTYAGQNTGFYIPIQLEAATYKLKAVFTADGTNNVRIFSAIGSGELLRIVSGTEHTWIVNTAGTYYIRLYFADQGSSIAITSFDLRKRYTIDTLKSDLIPYVQNQIDGLYEYFDGYYGANILPIDDLEVGSLTYTNGTENETTTSARTKFIKAVPGETLYVGIFGDKPTSIYCLLYDENKGYIGYTTSSVSVSDSKTLWLPYVLSNATYYVRFTFLQYAEDITDVSALKIMISKQGTALSGAYIPYNALYQYSESYDAENLDKRTIFKTGCFNKYLQTMNNLVKELYIPENSYKNDLRLSSVAVGNNNLWRLRLYTMTPSLTLIYDYSSENAPGKDVEIIELPSSVGASAYALVDWSAVPFGTILTGGTTDLYIVSEDCYDLNKQPTIKTYLDSTMLQLQDPNVGVTYVADKLVSGETSSLTTTFERNYNIPKDKSSVHLIAGAETHQIETSFTDEQKLFALMPYLYFGGNPVGTFVMLDNGNPFILLPDGTKKYLVIEE